MVLRVKNIGDNEWSQNKEQKTEDRKVLRTIYIYILENNIKNRENGQHETPPYTPFYNTLIEFTIAAIFRDIFRSKSVISIE